MMENTANPANTVPTGPEGCSGISGQTGTGPVNGGMGMGREGGQAAAPARDGGAVGRQGGYPPEGFSASSGSGAPQAHSCTCEDSGTAQTAGCEHSTPAGFPNSGVNPVSAGGAPMPHPGQMPGPAYPYGAAAPQGMPAGVPGAIHQAECEGGRGPAQPQGGYQYGAFQAPPYGSFNPGFAGTGPMPLPGQTAGGPRAPGQVGPQGVPGGGYPFTHPGQPFVAPGSPFMGHQQSQPHSQVSGQDASTCGQGHDHGPGHPKHDAHQFGKLMGLVNDIANGKTDPTQMIEVLSSLDTQFWKGAIVGIGATLLLTNETVKSAIGKTFSDVMASEKDKVNNPSE